MDRSAPTVMKGHKSSIQLNVLQDSTVIRDAIVSTSSFIDDEVTKNLAYVARVYELEWHDRIESKGIS